MAATATFEYQVRDRTGKLVKGKIDAESPAMVANKLTSMGYAPVSIEQAGTGFNKELHIPGMGEKVKLVDLAIMCRQFATMINSGPDPAARTRHPGGADRQQGPGQGGRRGPCRGRGRLEPVGVAGQARHRCSRR